jgi:hypothetical protein
MEDRTNKTHLRTALSMGSRQDTKLTGLSKKRNLPKETPRMPMRQQQHRHKRMPVLSRGSRQDTTLTGLRLSRQGALWKEMEDNKERKLAQQPSRKQEGTHTTINYRERMRENINMEESRDTFTTNYTSRQK